MLLLLLLSWIVGLRATEAAGGGGGTDNGLNCLYEGHLKTDKDWYGYLANITIMTTGSMAFEFSYPADKCCQNILFYQEEQMSIINARMNCWQKQALVMPEDDQILRLTPTFSWSGCHLTHPKGLPTYTCKGGRSFTSTTGSERPTSWYIAVSNCHSLMGLDLHYWLKVAGHIGECKQPFRLSTTTVVPPVPSPRVGQLGPENKAPQVSDKICVIEGTLNTTANWYGFISNVSLNRGGGFRFRLSYPISMQIQSVVLYNMQDVTKLSADQNCWQKDGVIRSRNVPEQIMELSYRASWNGCISRNSSAGGRTLICQGQRRFDSPRRIYLAVSNCRSHNGLYLDYRFEVTNYAGSLCSGSEPLVEQRLSGLLLLLVSVATVIATR